MIEPWEQEIERIYQSLDGKRCGTCQNWKRFGSLSQGKCHKIRMGSAMKVTFEDEGRECVKYEQREDEV